MNTTKRPTDQNIRHLRRQPWQPVFEANGDSQPQGLLDFPPTTNVSISCDLSYWQLFWVQLSNLLFSILTLGTYRFWGRTRLRRKIWHSLSVGGVRLLYHGTGMELFVSACLAVLVFLPPLGAATLVIRMMPMATIGFWAAMGGCLIGLLLLRFWAEYLRARYWAMKTTWRGISGSLSGSALGFAGIGFAHSLLVIVTLGLWWPRMQMILSGYIARHLSIGSYSPQWFENRKGLQSAWILVWGLGLLAVMCGLGVAAVSFFGTGSAPRDGTMRIEAMALSVLGLAALAVLVLAHMGYQVALVRARAASLALDDLYVFSRIDFSHVAWLQIRILAMYVVGAILVAILALLSFPIWQPWLANAVSTLATALMPNADDLRLLALQEWGTPVAILVVIWLVTRALVQPFVPILRATTWLHIHRQTLVFEGQVDFSKIAYIEPGRYRSLGEGIALALDTGGL